MTTISNALKKPNRFLHSELGLVLNLGSLYKRRSELCIAYQVAKSLALKLYRR